MDACPTILAVLVEDTAGALLQRLRVGEPQALADLYDLYGKLVYAIIVRLVNHPAVAEDLVQETFLRAWRYAGNLGQEYDCVGPWLLRIARHCALDYLKSPQSRVTAINLDEGWVAPVSIEGDLLTAEQSRALVSACEQLSANQRKVIDLAYYQGLSHSEIARQLNQPLGTVKSWMRLALSHLRSQMDRCLVERYDAS